MAKHLEIDDGDTVTKAAVEAPYGYKADGTPKMAPGRPRVNLPPKTVPDAAHAGPPLRRNNPRPLPREQTRDMAREPSRGNASVIGRNGEELMRRRPESGGDIYEKVKAPPGWTFQWNPVTALGKEMDEIELQMHENGWRPVPASRFPGIYTVPGYDGQIVHKGLRLEERPEILTKEAQYEDHMNARTQLTNELEALKLKQASLPGADVGARGNRISLKMDKSFTADIPRPSHMVEGDE